MSDVPARRFLTADEIQNLPKPEYRIQDILVMGSLAVLYGPPGCFKSFLALSWSLCVATGFQWLGRSVQQGPIVYVAGEGSAGIGARVRAWREHHRYTMNVDAFFLTSPANLSRPDEAMRLLEDIAEEVDGFPAMIVIDTLSRDLAGADENSQADMSAYVANLDKVRRVTGAAILLVHHTNKEGNDERGSTVLRGAADTMISIKPEDGYISVACSKQKDDAEFSKIHLRPIPVGESIVLGLTDGVRPRGLGLTEFETELLKGLNEGFMADGATATQWLEMFPSKKSSFYRGVKTLCESGLVDPGKGGRGSRYTLTGDGSRHLVSLGLKSVPDTESVLVSHNSGGLQSPRNETDADLDYDLWEAERAS